MKTLQVLEEAGRIAGGISLAQQGKAAKVVDKGTADDFATQADIDAGAAMEDLFRSELPEFPIAAEENRTGAPKDQYLASLQKILDGGQFIVIDDLDATFEYDQSVFTGGRLYGGNNYGHIAGTVENHQLTRCMMFMPRHEIMITAKKGEGCFANGSRHTLDQSARLEESLIYLVRHKDLPLSFDDCLTTAVYNLKPGGYVCYNSNIAAISGVVLGTLAACIVAGKLWDIPGLLAVQEAGGFIVSADGQALNLSRIPQVVIAAANEQIGQRLLQFTHDYDFQHFFWNNPKFQS